MTSWNSNPDFPLIAGSARFATLGIALLFNSSWTLTQLFSTIMDIAYPLASLLGVAYLGLAFHGFMTYNAKEINSYYRKKDTLFIHSILFTVLALINIRCYTPLIGSAFSLFIGESKAFLYMAMLDSFLAVWSFLSYHSLNPPKVKSPIASQ